MDARSSLPSGREEINELMRSIGIPESEVESLYNDIFASTLELKSTQQTLSHCDAGDHTLPQSEEANVMKVEENSSTSSSSADTCERMLDAVTPFKCSDSLTPTLRPCLEDIAKQIQYDVKDIAYCAVIRPTSRTSSVNTSTQTIDDDRPSSLDDRYPQYVVRTTDNRLLIGEFGASKKKINETDETKVTKHSLYESTLLYISRLIPNLKIVSSRYTLVTIVCLGVYLYAKCRNIRRNALLKVFKFR